MFGERDAAAYGRWPDGRMAPPSRGSVQEEGRGGNVRERREEGEGEEEGGEEGGKEGEEGME